MDPENVSKYGIVNFKFRANFFLLIQMVAPPPLFSFSVSVVLFWCLCVCVWSVGWLVGCFLSKCLQSYESFWLCFCPFRKTLLLPFLFSFSLSLYVVVTVELDTTHITATKFKLLDRVCCNGLLRTTANQASIRHLIFVWIVYRSAFFSC